MSSVVEDYIKHRDEVSIKLKMLLDESVLHIAKEFNQVIISREINPYSLAQIYFGASTKPYQITSKTKTNGLLAGFITCKAKEVANSRPVTLNFNNNKYVIIDSKEPRFSRCEGNVDDSIYALTDEHHRYITSDLDLFMILSKDAIGSVFFNEDYGYVNDGELLLIKYINEIFSSRLEEINSAKKYDYLELIKHGSANLFPKSKLECVNFPLLAYLPNNEKITLPDISALKSMLILLKDSGYKLDINLNWSCLF